MIHAGGALISKGACGMPHTKDIVDGGAFQKNALTKFTYPGVACLHASRQSLAPAP
jgi:hypothetical protein